MRDSTAASPHARALLAAALVTLGATAAHHVYGGVRYATPWRIHGAAVAVVIALGAFALFSAYQRRPDTPLGRAVGWTLALFVFVFVVLITGAFEGLYNHVLKNILFLGGAPRPLLLRLFPPPTYELPNDVGFELSGVAQAIPAAFAAVASLRFTRALSRRPGRPSSNRIRAGALIGERELVTVSGDPVRLPDTGRLVHLQFRRFAGCPVCNLHLRSFARRHGEIRRAGIIEVAVFHSSERELLGHTSGLPFAVIGDPDKRLYAELGVESAPRALLDPRAWIPILGAVLYGLVAILRGQARAPSAKPHGGRFGLPADFLIASDGRVLACKYGEHADDQWSVDELLDLADASK